MTPRGVAKLILLTVLCINLFVVLLVVLGLVLRLNLGGY